MFISELYIEKFRLFNKTTIKLGRYITAIAGFNATGKSTVLGLLSHCGELRPKRYKPLLYTFKAELGEILKFSENHDEKIPDLGKITFADYEAPCPPQLLYRAFWQKYSGGKRYRIIPKKTAEWASSGKIEWPTLYLGLGRLYPVGESLEVAKTNLSAKLSPEDMNYVIDNMKDILNIRDSSKDFTIATISETKKKKGVGFNTDTYNYLCNSAGQDNLGQILIALLSFKKLKAEMDSDWHGGLLVVDELDAALHPLAQNKLVNFLYHQAEEIGLQVVFTTHSLGLLDYVCAKTDHNSTTNINNYELVFLTNANGPVEIVQNRPFAFIYQDLMAIYGTPSSRRISIFSEDDEARYFIKKLLEKYSFKLNLLEACIGRDELLRMLSDDFHNFSQYIYVLDGDVQKSDIEDRLKKIAPAQAKCVLQLPGGKRPEEVIWDYIVGLQHDHQFFNWGRESGYSRRSIIEENGPFSNKYNGCSRDREKFKKWFNDNPQLVNDVYNYWYQDNLQSAQKFVDEFIEAYNWIAKRCFIPIIRPESREGEATNCQQPYLL